MSRSPVEETDPALDVTTIQHAHSPGADTHSDVEVRAYIYFAREGAENIMMYINYCMSKK